MAAGYMRKFTSVRFVANRLGQQGIQGTLLFAGCRASGAAVRATGQVPVWPAAAAGRLRVAIVGIREGADLTPRLASWAFRGSSESSSRMQDGPLLLEI